MKSEADYAAAFAAWWEDDFSWDGLADKATSLGGEFEGETPETLQDYWRSEESQLIDFAGRRWTRFHLPPHDLDNAPSPRARWTQKDHDAVWAGIVARIDAAAPASPDARDGKDADETDPDPRKPRAQLQGVVFQNTAAGDDRAPYLNLTHRRINASFVRAIFPQQVWFDGSTFYPSASFDLALFAARADFYGVRFLDSMDFHEITSLRSMTFVRAKARGSAYFYGARLSYSDFRMMSCEIGESARFVRTESLGDFRLIDSKLGEYCDFSYSQFLGRAADFEGSVFQAVEFEDVVFSTTLVDFSGAQFLGRANFRGAEFFAPISFRGQKFSGDAWFDKAQFHERADFLRTTFAADVGFQTATFHGDADFRYGSFDSEADFTRLVVRKGIDFGMRDFGGALTFDRAEFFGDASFSSTITKTFGFETRFSNCRFHHDVSFSGRQFLGDTTFERSTFGGAAEFFDCVLRSNTNFYACNFALPHSQEGWAAWTRQRFGGAASRSARDALSKKYEDAFRSLRIASFRQGNHENEGYFYAKEIAARSKRSDVDVIELGLGQMLGAFSSYGQNVWLPIAWLILLIFAAGVGVHQLTLAADAVKAKPSLLEVIGFTGRQFLPLPSVWSYQEKAASPEWAKAIMLQYPGFFEIGALFTSTLSVAMVALMLIAIRRRFSLR